MPSTASLQILLPARLVRRLLELLTLLLPILPVAYLYFFQDPNLIFHSHNFHEFAIALALLEGLFISYVSWRCYAHSGEVFVKWLTVGFIGFTVVYSLHGLFTPVAEHNIWLFLLYGPASRLLMSVCMAIALIKSGSEPDAPEVRENFSYWIAWFAVFLVINVAVAILAYSSLAGERWVRASQEFTSIALCLTSFLIIMRKSGRSPLMLYYAHALVWFAVSALAFMLSLPWNHLWWLAHGIFAGGFSILGYGVLRSYLTTQSFDRVFNQTEMFEDLAETNARLNELKDHLDQTNRRLEAQVQASEIARKQFETLFNLSPDGIIAAEAGGTIAQANVRAEQMFGYPPGGLVGVNVDALIPEELREKHARNRGLYEYSPSTRPMGKLDASLSCLHREGHRFFAAISISGMILDGRQCVMAFVRDLTHLADYDAQRHSSELASRTNGQLLDKVVSEFPALVFQFKRKRDGSYEIPYVDSKADEILALSAADLMSKGAALWFARVHPADLLTLIDTIEQAAAASTPWKADWRASLPGRDVLPFRVQMGSPEVLPNGAVLWTGYMRCIRQRKEDPPESAARPFCRSSTVSNNLLVPK